MCSAEIDVPFEETTHCVYRIISVGKQDKTPSQQGAQVRGQRYYEKKGKWPPKRCCIFSCFCQPERTSFCWAVSSLTQGTQEQRVRNVTSASLPSDPPQQPHPVLYPGWSDPLSTRVQIASRCAVCRVDQRTVLRMSSHHHQDIAFLQAKRGFCCEDGVWGLQSTGSIPGRIPGSERFRTETRKKLFLAEAMLSKAGRPAAETFISKPIYSINVYIYWWGLNFFKQTYGTHFSLLIIVRMFLRISGIIFYFIIIWAKLFFLSASGCFLGTRRLHLHLSSILWLNCTMSLISINVNFNYLKLLGVKSY